MIKILITGATGKIGGRVADILKVDSNLRLMSRNPDKIAGFEDAEKVSGDYDDPQSLQLAFADIDVAFIVSGYAAPGKRALLHKNAIDASVDAGVKHIIYLSFQGASKESAFPMSRDHAQTEEFIFAGGLSHTILRDSFYLDLINDMFGEERVMKGPGGSGKVAWVSREDVAQTIAKVIKNPALYQGIYDITGSESISLEETAERLTELSGKEYRYIDESVEDGLRWRRELGAPDWEVDTWIGSYLAISRGEVSGVSDNVQKITGKSPLTLEEYFTGLAKSE